MSKGSGQNHHSAAVHEDGLAPAALRRPFRLEAKTQPMLPPRAFARRLVRFGLLAAIIIGASLALGVVGYHYLDDLPWIDALLNASMILGGMGPVSIPVTVGGKLFSSFYALFSGIIFLVAVGVLLAPILHRFMHRFHLELDSDDDS